MTMLSGAAMRLLSDIEKVVNEAITRDKELEHYELSVRVLSYEEEIARLYEEGWEIK